MSRRSHPPPPAPRRPGGHLLSADLPILGISRKRGHTLRDLCARLRSPVCPSCSVRGAACVRTPFLPTAEASPREGRPHSVNPSACRGPVGLSPLLAIVVRAAGNTGAQVTLGLFPIIRLPQVRKPSSRRSATHAPAWDRGAWCRGHCGEGSGPHESERPHRVHDSSPAYQPSLLIPRFNPGSSFPVETPQRLSALEGQPGVFADSPNPILSLLLCRLCVSVTGATA